VLKSHTQLLKIVNDKNPIFADRQKKGLWGMDDQAAMMG
jgi:hypothetical protein